MFGLAIAFAFLTTQATAVKDQKIASVDLFEAVNDGKIEVKLVVKNGEKARIITRNKTEQPLTIEIPEAFAAVPVLAQNQGGGGGGGALNFNVPPEKVVKRDVGFVCLEHGKPNPRSTMQYEIKPIEKITTDERVVEVIRQFGAGHLKHASAQAAVWHLANHMSWQELASKQRRNLYGKSNPYFSTTSLQQAARIVSWATRAVEQRQEDSRANNYSLAK
jgi:hypothetical protein